ncbi:MAG: hypothetical protein NTX25_18935 [Proteobacteria bacterium]|nr:hypothetical protein [Pseudomonadota bacterium]
MSLPSFSILFFTFFFASKVFSYSYSSVQYCFSDIGKCYFISYEKSRLAATRIGILEGETFDGDRVAVANGLGIDVYTVPQKYWAVYAQGSPVVNTTLADQAAIFGHIPDEQWAAWKSGVICTASSIGCGAAVYQTIGAFGLGFWLSQVTCTVAIAECLEMIRNVEIWSAIQNEKKVPGFGGKIPINGMSTGSGESSGAEGGHTSGSMGPAHATLTRVTTIPSGQVTITFGDEGGKNCAWDAGGRVTCRTPL